MSEGNPKSDSTGSEQGSATPQTVKVPTSDSAKVISGSATPQTVMVPARNAFRPISPHQAVREALSPELNNHLEGLLADEQTRGKLVDTMVALTKLSLIHI